MDDLSELKVELEKLNDQIRNLNGNMDVRRKRDALLRKVRKMERLPPVFETIQTKQCKKE